MAFPINPILPPTPPYQLPTIFRQYPATSQGPTPPAPSGQPSWYPPSTPQSTATAWRYRRTTHDAYGVAQISAQQQAVWEAHWPIGCCVSDTDWRTVLEITAFAKGYVETRRMKMLVNEDSVRAALTALEGEKLIESKYGEATP